MYYGIPEGYYSLTQVFHFLGRDTFGESAWKKMANECTHYRLLHEITPRLEKEIMSQIYVLLLSIDYSRNYRRYSSFTTIDSCLCDLRVQNMIEHSHDWHMRDLIGSARPPENLKKFMEYVFRYILIKKRLVWMMEHAGLTIFIHDQRTDHTREISFTLWRASDFLEGNGFLYDFFTGFGSYTFSEDGIPIPYKGFLLVEKEAFEKFRAGDYESYSKEELLDVIDLLTEKLKKQETQKEEFQSWPSHYTTPEIEGIKRVVSTYNITYENQPTVEQARDYFRKECPGITGNIAAALATVVRTPEVRKGGYYKSPKFQGHSPKKE